MQCQEHAQLFLGMVLQLALLYDALRLLLSLHFSEVDQQLEQPFKGRLLATKR